jgi:acyl carrier protein
MDGDHGDLDGTIRQVLEECALLAVPVGEVGDATDLFDAGMSSHASVNVMLALEDAFEVEFPEAMLKRSTFESIASLRSSLLQLLGS